jgi:hypothetical protein
MTEMKQRRDPGLIRRVAGVGLAALLCASAVILSPAPADGETGSAWKRIDPAAMTDAQKAKKAKAESARDALAGELQGALRAAMRESGPVAAIDVCKKAAPKIAGEISAEQGVKIGRTSFRLRNPKNTPPAWAAELVERQESKPAYLTGPGGELGAFFPIHVRAPCMICHGPAEKIPSNVKERLARLYPDDEATGFEPRDLRGWFWAEVP